MKIALIKKEIEANNTAPRKITRKKDLSDQNRKISSSFRR
jgi:hypothetical protein